jgi:exodeoxyribonuclease V alpha subunit
MMMINEEQKITGIVQRVTFHSDETGWSVLRVNNLSDKSIVTVVVHQTKVFAGATLEFSGKWNTHPKFGVQFKANKVTEKKPADAAALEKYLGSGLIYGVGPKTAKKIVEYFKKETLKVFESNIEKLLEVPGIASKKLNKIKDSWEEHKEIRDIMIFLGKYNISSLYAVKIYKKYGQDSIQKVEENPYNLARDIYGIGFLSADKVAMSMNIDKDSPKRIMASISHVLDNSRDFGHCYLTFNQIKEQSEHLINIQINKLDHYLNELAENNELKIRKDKDLEKFYSPILFNNELEVSEKIKQLSRSKIVVDNERIKTWVDKYCEKNNIQLSTQQKSSVLEIPKHQVSILTGGPGCGKTTTTKVIFTLLKAMGKNVTLAAPTGRAAQRMSEVIGHNAKTIHRLLEWDPTSGGFKKNKNDALNADFIICDESSMLDITLSSSLLNAIKDTSHVLFIGDPDQLPSVGAGNFLKDLISSESIPVFKLTQVFRQAAESSIIKFAHQINSGIPPKIVSPLPAPFLWIKEDCLFVDSYEISQEEKQFIAKSKRLIEKVESTQQNALIKNEKKDELQEIMLNDKGKVIIKNIEDKDYVDFDFKVPSKFSHVKIQQFIDQKNTSTENEIIEELKFVLKKIPKWSTLNFGLTATDILKKMYLEIIPKYYGNTEIQILSPMAKGSMGTHRLNNVIQATTNPASEIKKEMKYGEKTYRINDRVIQKRNNYDLNVFNGDIGKIIEIDHNASTFDVKFNYGKSFRIVQYKKEYLNEIDLAYAITIHKSQGSEFPIVIIPIMTQHFKMLYRNLIYTGVTRAKKLAVFVGMRKALNIGVMNSDPGKRQTYLKELLQNKKEETS